MLCFMPWLLYLCKELLLPTVKEVGWAIELPDVVKNRKVKMSVTYWESRPGWPSYTLDIILNFPGFSFPYYCTLTLACNVRYAHHTLISSKVSSLRLRWWHLMAFLTEPDVNSGLLWLPPAFASGTRGLKQSHYSTIQCNAVWSYINYKRQILLMVLYFLKKVRHYTY